MKHFKVSLQNESCRVFASDGRNESANELLTLALPAGETAQISTREVGTSLLLEAHLPLHGQNEVALPVQTPDVPTLCSTLFCSWWMTAFFPTDEEGNRLGDLPGRTQAIFMKLADDLHALLLCLPGERHRTAIEKGRVRIVTGNDTATLEGAFLSLTLAPTPYAAAEQAFADLRGSGVLPVALRREREYPEMLRGFGFCSWNAFYQDVTAEGLFAKMDEFKAAGVPVDFVVIDDGWSLLQDGKLASFEADPEKFPGGLAPAVKRLKEEYGVRYVGVWHAIQGYWGGVSPEGALYEQEKENLIFTKDGGTCLPAPDEEKAFAFYDHFYTALKAEGVDFVKVDVQAGLVRQLNGITAPSEGLRRIHRDLERAVDKHFAGTIINCMGMDFECGFARPHTAVNRNSDDFFVNETDDPKKGFVSHAIANVYNALTDGELYYTDFDMWWSVHPEAKRSAVLRALSGGPQYVSDRLRDPETAKGGSNAAVILPLLDRDGRALFPLHAGRPTIDCIYVDPRKEGILKVWNEGELGFAVAAFNCGTEERSGALRLSDIPSTTAPHGYVALEYFTGETTVLRPNEALEFTLPTGPDHLKLWNLYPLREDGSAIVGDKTKYLGVSTPMADAQLWKGEDA